MGTALQKMGGDLTVGDILLIEIPHIPESEREYFMWEYTGWPEWFDCSKGESWLQVFRGQLRQLRKPVSEWPEHLELGTPNDV